MNVEDLINNANNIGDCPDMFHPDYGWIRKDGQLTEKGKEYFEDQLEQWTKTAHYVGNC